MNGSAIGSSILAVRELNQFSQYGNCVCRAAREQRTHWFWFIMIFTFGREDGLAESAAFTAPVLTILI